MNENELSQEINEGVINGDFVKQAFVAALISGGVVLIGTLAYRFGNKIVNKIKDKRSSLKSLEESQIKRIDD